MDDHTADLLYAAELTALRVRAERAERVLHEAFGVVTFYGDPETYRGLAFLADAPCAFLGDLGDVGLQLGTMPGRRARDFLQQLEARRRGT